MKIHFDKPRRWRLVKLGGAAVIVLVALAVVMMRDGGEAPPGVIVGALLPSSVQVTKAAPSAAPASAALVLPRAAPETPAPDKCIRTFGLGTAAEPDATRDAAALAAHNRLLSLLRARGDDLSLALTHLGDDSNQAARSGEIARLASRSRDPAVVVLALTICRGEPHPDCRRLTAEQWRQRDPESAWPWLQIAADAFQRGDGGAADAALHRAVAASWDGSGAGLEPLFDLPTPDDEALVAKWGLLGRALAAQHMVQGLTGPVVIGCRRLHVGEDGSNKRPASAALAGCKALAEKLSTGPTLMDRFSAYAIGEAVGWPPARVASTRAEMHALQDFAIAGLPQTEDCAGIKALATITRQNVIEGEIAATQRRMKAAGVTIEQLMARRRAQEASRASSASERSTVPAR